VISVIRRFLLVNYVIWMLSMGDLQKQLWDKIQKHRSEGACEPDCWCRLAEGVIHLYHSALEANKLCCKRIEELERGGDAKVRHTREI